MKRAISMLLVLSLLMMGAGDQPVKATQEEPKVYDNLGTAQAAYVQDEILVKFKNDAKPFRTVKVPPGQVKDQIEAYSKRADVVYAEPNYYAYALTSDPLYKYQWNLLGADKGGMNAEAAWTKSTGVDFDGKGVIVAVIDTGIAYENYENYYLAPDLAGATFVTGYDAITEDGHPNDDNSHGTHVAGTIAQSTNNGIGVAGVAYNVRLMPIKVLDASGSGTYDDIANGIYYAADNGAKVINMSLGGSTGAAVLEAALAYAYGKGVTIVAAAGNDGLGRVSYPAAYDQYVIAVGATRFDKKLAGYSNYGSSLDLVAPGGDTRVDQNRDGVVDGIVQNTFNPTTKATDDFGYYLFQGTSMAAPHVAAAAALVIANFGEEADTPAEVQTILQKTAIDLGSAGRDNSYGYGLIDANAALQPLTAANTAPVAQGQSVSTTINKAKAVTLKGTDAENDPLTYIIVAWPVHGTLSGTAPNLVYTPAKNYVGTDSFTFKVNDGKLDSSTATVTISVQRRK